MRAIGRRRCIATLGATVAATAVLGACASSSPRLYTIAIVPGPVLAAGPAVIVVRTVGVAQYLIRRQIVRSSENYRIDVMENDWWGEPLDAMLGRVLVQELGERLPHSHVYQATGAVIATPDASVEVEVQHLDLDAGGQLLLIAQAAVTFGPRTQAARRGFRIAVPPPVAGAAGQAAATSSAVGRMADGIAEMLARQPGR